MRVRVRCEGRSSRYRLRVSVAGRVALVDTLVGGGVRRDRPIHLLRDLRLEPGVHRVGVVVERVDSVPVGPALDSTARSGEIRADTDRDRREAEERARAEREALPARLVADTLLAIGAGRVVLVRYDPDRRRLWFDGGTTR
jgi:hypothetical protein